MILVAFTESGCLGLQPKVGGKLHLMLNTGTRPIANKYREGKVKSTLKRESKRPRNRWREANANVSAPCGFREAACLQLSTMASLQAATVVHVPSHIPAPELPASMASTATGREAGDCGQPSADDRAYSHGRCTWRRSRRAQRFAQQCGPFPLWEWPGRFWSSGPAGEGLLDSV